MGRSLSDSRLFYCGTADASRIFRQISLDRSTVRLKRVKNPPRPSAPSLRARKSDRLPDLREAEGKNAHPVEKYAKESLCVLASWREIWLRSRDKGVHGYAFAGALPARPG